MSLLDRGFAAVYDRMLAPAEKAGLGRHRSELLAGLAGHVVEIGAGTGLNLPHYLPAVTHLTLVEPTPEMAERLRSRVASQAPGTDRSVDVFEAPAEMLPVADASADHVVATLVLCTVSDVELTLLEVRRVLRTDGSLVLLEHVATDGGWGRFQKVIQPAWTIAARGCQLTRDTRSLLASAGFDVSEVADTKIPGTPWTSPAIRGVARPI